MKKQEFKPKHFILHAEPYKQDILVCINKRSKDINKILKNWGMALLSEENSKWVDSKKPGSAGYAVNWEKNLKLIVIFPRNSSDKITLFDHEKIHILHDIMDHIGLGKLSGETEEAYAYLSESLMDQYLKKA